MTRPLTFFEKIWNSHLVDTQDDGIHLLYIDRHLVHEVVSPCARHVWQPGGGSPLHSLMEAKC